MMRSLSLAVDPVPPVHEVDGSPMRSTRPSEVNSQAEVAKEAYGLFLERGGAHGHDVEDWLRAEQILRERRSIACDLGVADSDL
jgi:hypothetical protein